MDKELSNEDIVRLAKEIVRQQRMRRRTAYVVKVDFLTVEEGIEVTDWLGSVIRGALIDRLAFVKSAQENVAVEVIPLNFEKYTPPDKKTGY